MPEQSAPATFNRILKAAIPRLRQATEREWPFGPNGDMPGPETLLTAVLSWAAIQRQCDVFPEASYRNTSERIDLLILPKDEPAIAVEFKMIGGLGSPSVAALANDADKLPRFEPRLHSSKVEHRVLVVGSWNTLLTEWWAAAAAGSPPAGTISKKLAKLTRNYMISPPALVWQDSSPTAQRLHLLVAHHRA